MSHGRRLPLFTPLCPCGQGLAVRVQALLLPAMARLSERAVGRSEIGPRQAARP
ncbi:MAG: hypothetical protein LBE51_01295 [Acidovorax sp.]|jgi:hypothetical protein|nr:hypothetical protein [Acidovorax sp.]